MSRACYRTNVTAVADRGIKPLRARCEGADVTNAGDKVTWREYALEQFPPIEPWR